MEGFELSISVNCSLVGGLACIELRELWKTLFTVLVSSSLHYICPAPCVGGGRLVYACQLLVTFPSVSWWCNFFFLFFNSFAIFAVFPLLLWCT